MSEKKQYYCNQCKMSKQDTEFYTYRSGEKMEICKRCLTRHLDNFDEETYAWILEKLDYPYIPDEWNEIRSREMAKKPGKPLGATTVLGRYISKMKLKQYKHATYKDSERLIEEKKQLDLANMRDLNISAAADTAELEEMYKKGDISEAEYKTFINPTSATDPNFYTPPESVQMDILGSSFSTPVKTEFDDSLTEEDKRYLSIKWGSNYNAEQWVRLEQNYKEMIESFDIRDADTITTLKHLCKTNLKMNEAIDLGDIDTFQKLSRVYESLRKTAKFTAAQNKEISSDAIDSVGELVAMCEKEGGFIPRYCLDVPQDKIDATIIDMKKYTYDLVTGEMGLGKMIEEAAQQIKMQQEEDEKDVMDYEEEVLSDADFQEYFDLDDEEGDEDGTS